MSMTGGAIVLRALEDEEIPFAFGIPGTHNIELYDALATSEAVRPVLVTDEQSASFMADAVWRASGRMACVNVVPGAGLTHALSGIAEAFMDHVPMLVLGCGIRRDTGKAFQLHDVDQRSIVAPVVKGTFLPSSGQELYDMLREACLLARSGAPGPVFVEVSVDLYLFTHEVSLPKSGGPTAAPRPAADEALLRRAVELIRRGKKRGVKVSAEVAPHHFTLTDSACLKYDTNAKMAPPLREQGDVGALREGLKDGTIDCIATDHAPHAVQEKEVEFDNAAFGIVGLETALPLCLELVRDGLISPERLIEAMAVKPASIINVDKGSLSVGSVADVTVIDPDIEWTVRPENFRSKGRNTPFAGRKVKGRATHTIVNGEVVYELDGQV